MDSAAEVLVIIVSSVLAIFLIVLITALVLIIKLLQDIKRITSKAEHVVDSVETAAAFFERTSPAVAIFKTLAKVMETVSKRKKEK